MANEVQNNDFYPARLEDLSAADAEAADDQAAAAMDGTDLKTRMLSRSPGRKAPLKPQELENAQKKIKTEVKEEKITR